MAFKQISLDFDNMFPPQKPAAVEEQPVQQDESGQQLEETLVEIPVVAEEIVVDEVVREVEVVPEHPKPASNKKSTRGRMKLKDMHNGVDLIEVPDDEALFQKRYYNIGAVSEMFKVNISLIRFWENEFDILRPKKNGKGDRLFRPEDVKNLKMIYHLLREKKYTIEGAKEFLRKNKKAEENYALVDSLQKMKAFFLELKSTL